MNSIQLNDQSRRTASAIVTKAAELAGFEAPLPGLGVAITEAQEQVFQAISSGSKISAPGPWIAQCYPDDAYMIFEYLKGIYDNLLPAHRALAS